MSLSIFFVCCYNYAVIKIFFIKHKRIFLIISAVVFLVALFLIKNKSVFEKYTQYANNNEKGKLTAMTLQELVYKDADGDGVVDWQESLYGLDPTKKETTPGIPDSTAISKLKNEQGNNTETMSGGVASAGIENLTETDKFSRELFAAIAAANQNGAMDQNTIDALGATLAEKIENPVSKKIWTVAEIKITDSETKQTIQKYSDSLNNIYLKNPIKKGVMDILQEFINDEENANILSELDAVAGQTNKIIAESLKIEVPKSLSALHLDLINNLQKAGENISDIRLLEKDSVVAMGAIIQYTKNAPVLALAAKNLTDAIEQKLKD